MRSTHSRMQWRVRAETALIVGLASLVAIKGFGAFSGVVSALAGMAGDLLAMVTS